MLRTMSRWSHNIKTIDGVNHHYITWPQQPISTADYNKIRKTVLHNRQQWTITPAVIRAIERDKPAGVTLQQAMSIRAVVIKEKILNNHKRVMSKMTQIAAEYDTVDILTLSYKYSFPPIALLRGIFVQKGISRKMIHAALTNRKNNLSSRDANSIVIANANDAENSINQLAIAIDAQYNEDKFVAWISTLGIKKQTQAELAEIQVAMYGRATLTPDVLFNEPVFINGQPVHWIDFKSYVGTPMRMLYANNAAQAAKYTLEWGPGAVCFRLSYVESLTFADAIVLDGSGLGIEYRE